jgi:uncharacterized protein YndB with AHSA1/START domain
VPNATESRPTDTTLIMTREIAAPRATVFEVWTSAEHVKHWFAPDGFELDCDLDFRVGGLFRIRMIGHGMDHTARATYREIVRPERIVQTVTFDDTPGVEMTQTITFAERGASSTTITMRQELVTPWASLTPEHRQMMRLRWDGSSIGWGQTLDHLETYVATRKR